MATKKKIKDSAFLQSEKALRVKLAGGVILLSVSLFVALSIISFIFTGGADRSIFDLSFIDLLGSKHIDVRNIMGKYGAWVSDCLVTNGVGFMSLLLPWVMFRISLKMLHLWNVQVKSLLWNNFLLIVWGSVMLGYLFDGYSADTYLLAGGIHGHFLAMWLVGAVGSFGACMMLIVLFVCYMVLTRQSWADGLSALIAKLSSNKLNFKLLVSDLFGSQEIAFEEERQPQETEPAEAEPEVTGEFGDGPEIVVDEPQPDESDSSEPEEDGFTVLPDEEEPPRKSAALNADSGDSEEVPLGDGVPQTVPVIVNPTGDGEDTVEDFDNMKPYDPKLDLEYYKYPSIDLLKDREDASVVVDKGEVGVKSDIILQTLSDFGVEISRIHVTKGPTVTLFELEPQRSVRVAKVKQYEMDIAVALKAQSIRMIVPMPGRGTIGIEIPNDRTDTVSMKSVVMSKKFVESKYELPVVLGKTINNEAYVFDLAKAPHLLVAGATGQGKSVGLNAIITSILYSKHPSEVKFVMMDPKFVELTPYRKLLNHFMAKMSSVDDGKVVITDSDSAKITLLSLVEEMENRYALLEKCESRNIVEYNTLFKSRRLNPEKGHRFLPYIVVIMDEYADMMMGAGKQGAKEMEMYICRIAQKARAVGIHIILTTQRPSADVVTSLIKANFPARIAFKVSSPGDSVTILGESGAQHLIGRGDLLAKIGGGNTVRVQCAFVDTPEVVAITDFVSKQQGYGMPYELPEPKLDDNGQAMGGSTGGMDDLAPVKPGEFDPMIRQVATMIIESGMSTASTSNVQRNMNLGFNRAGRIMDQLARMGIVGPQIAPAKPREVKVRSLADMEDVLASFGVK